MQIFRETRMHYMDLFLLKTYMPEFNSFYEKRVEKRVVRFKSLNGNCDMYECYELYEEKKSSIDLYCLSKN